MGSVDDATNALPRQDQQIRQSSASARMFGQRTDLIRSASRVGGIALLIIMTSSACGGSDGGTQPVALEMVSVTGRVTLDGVPVMASVAVWSLTSGDCGDVPIGGGGGPCLSSNTVVGTVGEDGTFIVQGRVPERTCSQLNFVADLGALQHGRRLGDCGSFRIDVDALSSALDSPHLTLTGQIFLDGEPLESDWADIDLYGDAQRNHLLAFGVGGSDSSLPLGYYRASAPVAETACGQASLIVDIPPGRIIPGFPPPYEPSVEGGTTLDSIPCGLHTGVDFYFESSTGG